MSKIIENFNKEDEVSILQEADFDPKTGQWFSGWSFKVNDPITINVQNGKKTIYICNYYLKPIKGAILSITDGINDMPIYYFEDFKPLHYYKMHIPIERFSNISKSLTKDKIQFRMINLSSEYEELKKINVCWKANIPISYKYLNSQNHSRSEIQNLIVQLTNFAYILSSKDFEIVMDNFKDITGKKLDKLSWRTDDGRSINQDENKRCWNLENTEQKKYFFDVLGVNSNTYGGKKARDSFTYGMCSPSFKGRGVTEGTWNYSSLESSHGWAFYNRPDEMRISETVTVSSVLIHEMAHMFGYNHYSMMCVGPVGESSIRVVQTLGYLLRKSMPYYDFLGKEKTRCGFNSLEQWIYNNRDKFSEAINKEFDESIEARNKELDNINSNIKNNNEYNQKVRELAFMPPAVRNLYLNKWGLKPVSYTALDNELFGQYGNMSQFKKITK